MFNQCENVYTENTMLHLLLSCSLIFRVFTPGVLADVNGIERPIFVSLLVSAILTPIQLVHNESVIPDRSLQVQIVIIIT